MKRDTRTGHSPTTAGLIDRCSTFWPISTSSPSHHLPLTGTRLKTLREEQQRLERKQAELLEKRRAEIGRLVEKLGLLEADDDMLAGALFELKDTLDKTGDERLARWRAAGASFRRKDKDRKAAPPRADAGVAEPNPDASRR